jgi:hypothetical protein
MADIASRYVHRQQCAIPSVVLYRQHCMTVVMLFQQRAAKGVDLEEEKKKRRTRIAMPTDSLWTNVH